MIKTLTSKTNCVQVSRARFKSKQGLKQFELNQGIEV